MSILSVLRNRLSRCWRADDGGVTVEFVIVFPFVMSFVLLALDSGVAQLRQTFLARAVDLTMREVRLGNVSASDNMAALICARTSMVPDCRTNITVEMQPINTTTFAGLDAPLRCVDRQQQITPAVTFNPGAGADAQELMLVRVCVVTNPFIRLTGWALGIPVNEKGDQILISTGVFVNEPR
ncbi:MAG: pilus assembly protein [Rhodobacteraceae bacterium]|nr:MAG: pilus assembly protein [Paracoccaceae bacterium]